MEIIKLTQDNIQDILELEEKGAPAPHMYWRYDKEALENLFSDKQAEAFGVFKDNQLVGWASYKEPWNDYKHEKGVYEMGSLVVDPEYRREKLGLALFNHRLNIIKAKPDLKLIYATMHPANTPILCLYLSNGFIIYDFKKDKYGPGADRVYVKYNQ